MTNIRHTGIYVKDLQKMEQFYKNVFGMHTICSRMTDSNNILGQLFGGGRME